MKIKKLHKDAILPRYATEGASAFDLFAYEDVEWELINGIHYSTVNTGWAFEIPHEHALLIYSRSGHGFKHATSLSNSVGVIDFDFTLEVKVRLECKLSTPPKITAGTAIAQGILTETPKVYFAVVEEIKKGKHIGFGSTGM